MRGSLADQKQRVGLVNDYKKEVDKLKRVRHAEEQGQFVGPSQPGPGALFHPTQNLVVSHLALSLQTRDGDKVEEKYKTLQVS